MSKNFNISQRDALQALNHLWIQRGKGQRLGQFFTNYWLKQDVPGLYNEPNQDKALSMIRDFMEANQWYTLPDPIRPLPEV